ncbi:hypothetical protein V7152_18980 [Neobacillus drentensis]|uniref:hypothetical protein n=1 Tax=Neobacillus drentensis TaxID=220684 RepID=UPI002FFEDD0F
MYGKGLQISKDDFEELKQFLEGQYKIEAYCRECKAERIFTAITESTGPSQKSASKASIKMGLPLENETDYSPNGQSVNVMLLIYYLVQKLTKLDVHILTGSVSE